MSSVSVPDDEQREPSVSIGNLAEFKYVSCICISSCDRLRSAQDTIRCTRCRLGTTTRSSDACGAVAARRRGHCCKRCCRGRTTQCRGHLRMPNRISRRLEHRPSFEHCPSSTVLAYRCGMDSDLEAFSHHSADCSAAAQSVAPKNKYPNERRRNETGPKQESAVSLLGNSARMAWMVHCDCHCPSSGRTFHFPSPRYSQVGRL